MSARPPDPGNDCASVGRSTEARDTTAADTPENTEHSARWQVRIVNPETGKPKVFNTHGSRELAEAEAAKLRAHKMFAQIRRVDVEPEFRNSRRAFLIAMFAIGAVPRERVVDRIVADLEREAAT